MLRIANTEEIEGLLLQVPELVRLQEERSFYFPQRTKEWLLSLEQAFAANRLYQTGLVAALRSSLTSAEQGQLLPGLQFRGQATRSKVMVATASQALQGAVELASSVLAENRPRLGEGERIAQQIVAAARARDLIPAREKDANNSQYLRSIRRILATTDDLENGAVHLEGIVGVQDALIFLDRALSVDSTGG